MVVLVQGGVAGGVRVGPDGPPGSAAGTVPRRRRWLRLGIGETPPIQEGRCTGLSTNGMESTAVRRKPNRLSTLGRMLACDGSLPVLGSGEEGRGGAAVLLWPRRRLVMPWVIVSVPILVLGAAVGSWSPRRSIVQGAVRWFAGDR